MEQDLPENTFHYTRSERLKNAPDNVADFYSGKVKMPPKGLFKILFYSKVSRITFIVLLVMLAFVGFMSLLDHNENIVSINGSKILVSAFSFDDTIYTTVTMENKKIIDTIPVKIKFNCYNKENIIITDFETSGFFNGEKTFFRTTFTDYDILYVKVDVDYNGKKTDIQTVVEKK